MSDESPELGESPGEIEQYAIVASRRQQWGTLLWQMPTMVLTGEAFLFTISLGAQTSQTGRIVAAMLSLLVALASLHSFASHRLSELADSAWLHEYERAHGVRELHGLSWRAAAYGHRHRAARVLEHHGAFGVVDGYHEINRGLVLDDGPDHRGGARHADVGPGLGTTLDALSSRRTMRPRISLVRLLTLKFAQGRTARHLWRARTVHWREEASIVRPHCAPRGSSTSVERGDAGINSPHSISPRRERCTTIHGRRDGARHAFMLSPSSLRRSVTTSCSWRPSILVAPRFTPIARPESR
ncbi:MAG: hypothetical protein HKL85_06125 [Acidimicrobiaceae bacterium]|nr:hypothetical protein [Acidimicrobiaceae bacterium]